jgi:hypothetical protein
MSVIGHPDSELIRWLGQPINDCFWCGNPLGPITVFWSACGGHLALHPACAKELGVIMIFEGERALMVGRGQNPMAGVVARSPRNGDPKVVELRRDRNGP